MTPTIIGVDPGKGGGIVVNDAHRLELYTMPVITSKKRAQYDLRKIHDILFAARLAGPCHCFIEKQQPLPPRMGGGSANFFRGYSLALFEGMLVSLNVPYTVVAPRAWQKDMLADVIGDDTKQRAVLACDRLFPNVDTRRSERARKPDLGIVDALLICEYGRRTLNGRTSA